MEDQNCRAGIKGGSLGVLHTTSSRDEEKMGLPPQKIYHKDYAARAFKEADKVINLVSQLLEEGMDKVEKEIHN